MSLGYVFSCCVFGARRDSPLVPHWANLDSSSGWKQILLKKVNLWVGFRIGREMRKIEPYSFDVISVQKEFPTAYSFGIREGNQAMSHKFRVSVFWYQLQSNRHIQRNETFFCALFSRTTDRGFLVISEGRSTRDLMNCEQCVSRKFFRFCAVIVLVHLHFVF